MFLNEIQHRPPEGMMRLVFKKLRDVGRNIPEILHLFRFKKRSTGHLIRFTDAVMRGPSPLSHGLRELIGAFVSSRNQCGFCSCAHAPVAAELLGKELVDEVLRDPETSRLDSAHKELFRYVGKLAVNSALVTASDVDRLKKAGWSEEAIYDALTVASVFKFYNTWNNGSGVRNMTPADYAHSGRRLVAMGYSMDFNLTGIVKTVWAGRREITASDLKELVLICFGRKGTGDSPAPTQALVTEEQEWQQTSAASQTCALNGMQKKVLPMVRGGRRVERTQPPARHAKHPV